MDDVSGTRFPGRPKVGLDTPFVDIVAQQLAQHRKDAHAFVDELLDKEGPDGENNQWRRLLSAMMEDFERWKGRDKTKAFTPVMLIPLSDMTGDDT